MREGSKDNSYLQNTRVSLSVKKKKKKVVLQLIIAQKRYIYEQWKLHACLRTSMHNGKLLLHAPETPSSAKHQNGTVTEWLRDWQ